jgi:colicin import membrane protein
LKLSSSEPGLIVSGTVHVALLLTMILAFAGAQKFEDAQESVAVDVVSDSQFNEIMKGEKTAEPKPDSKPRAEKAAEATETKPTPPLNEAKRDIPAPPPKPVDPGTDDRPEPPRQIASLAPAAVPPSAPPEPPKRTLDPVQETIKPDAEAIEKSVRPKSEPKKDSESKPATEPPKKIRPAEKAEPKPNTNTLEQVARLLEQKKLEDLVKAEPKPTRPKPSDTPIPRKFDLTAISKLLTREAPQQTASTAADVNHTASLGTTTGNAARLSPSLIGELNSYLISEYHRCWNYSGIDAGSYAPKINVHMNVDGSLAGDPRLLNPSADPASRALAESALQAIRMCSPLNMPARFQPLYQEWKDKNYVFKTEDF